LHSAAFVDATPTTLTLNQLQGRDVDNGLRIEEYVAPGTVDRAISLIMEGNFGVAMRTFDLLTAMQGGISFTTGFNAAGGATFRYQKRAPNAVSGTGTVGAFVTGSNHKTKTSTGGMIMPVSLAVSQGQLATLTLAYFAFWTGDRSVLPLVNNNSASLSGTPAHNSTYTLGPVKYGSDYLNGLIGWELQTGLEFVPRLRDGLTYPVDGYIRMRMPRIILKFDTPDIQDQVGRLSHAALGSAITVYARRKSGTTGDGNVSDATSAHVSISAAAGSWKVDPTGVSDHDNAAGQVTILPTGVITTSYAAAITS
jgi:hypothetical protein